MSHYLLIVESPAKCATIQKFLKDSKDTWTVKASFGHIRAFPKRKAIDVKNDFALTFELLERNKSKVAEIKRLMARADGLYLATDLDREGEGISWHLLEVLKDAGLVKDKPVRRITFSEITQHAIMEAIAHPRGLDMNLVHAQQARAALDYLVGFNLSPVLWRKVKPHLSAGRVQSPALRMIAEREAQIKAFKPEEYWSLDGLFEKGVSFKGKLTTYLGEKVTEFFFPGEKAAQEAKAILEKASQGKVTVRSVKKQDRTRKPYPPFTTSTLQMEASRKLGFDSAKTMRLAQTLYEGLSLQGEHVGLISYMRTDAVNLSEEALVDVRSAIEGAYGPMYLPPKAIRYQAKSKNAQEAHEAIRPSSMRRTPEVVKAYVDHDAYRLYDLIWKRTMACQMASARMAVTSVDLEVPTAPQVSSFRASGTVVLFPGFLAIYDVSTDDPQTKEEKALPVLVEGESVKVTTLSANQHFTEPPAHYTEATLVKSMEENDIGRPSTYANIIKVLKDRQYVAMQGKRFAITDLGSTVSRFLTKFFATYVDFGFTGRLENELDAIARGEDSFLRVLSDFWKPFKEQVDMVSHDVDRSQAGFSRLLGEHPETHRKVYSRVGRFGPVIQMGDRGDTGPDAVATFASMPEDLSVDDVTLEQAVQILAQRTALPKDLGNDATGKPVTVGKGKFGPYVKVEKLYVSLEKGQDPLTLTLEEALVLIEAKRKAIAERLVSDLGEGVQIRRGKFGLYLTDGKLTCSLKPPIEPENLDLASAKAFLKENGHPPGKGFKRFGSGKSEHAKPVKEKAVKVSVDKGVRMDDLPF